MLTALIIVKVWRSYDSGQYNVIWQRTGADISTKLIDKYRDIRRLLVEHIQYGMYTTIIQYYLCVPIMHINI